MFKFQGTAVRVIKTCMIFWAGLGSIRLAAEATWVPIGPEGGSVKRLLQDLSNPNVVYLVSGDYPSRMFKSTDKGSHWIEMALNFQSYLVALELNRKNPSEMFTCGYSTFYKSTNSGGSWTSVYISGYNFLDISPDSVDQNILHGCGYEWNSTTKITSMAYYKSTDKGSNWSKIVLPSTESGYPYVVAVEPKNSRRVWIGGYMSIDNVSTARLYRTTNGGTGWTDVTGTITGIVQDIFVDSTNVKRILVITSANTFRSTDNGASWQTCSGNPNGNRVTQDSKNKNTFYIAGYNQAYKSTDGGVNWIGYTSGLTGKYGNDIIVDRSVSNNVFAGYQAGFFKSTDGGVSWNASVNGLQITNVTALELSTGPSPALYAAVYNEQLFKTSNPLAKADQAQAVVWTKLPAFIDCHNLTDVQVLPTDPNVVLAFEGGG